MSYVSIWRPVNDRIVKASRGSQNEIIGLLLGRLEDDTIIIEDSVTGESETEPTRVALPAQTIAKIADGILSQRIKGKIVGWYHSHTESGLFFSEMDTQTQTKLQQFSPFVTGMVVDAKTGEVGYFRVDTQTKKAARIAGTNIRIYDEPSEAVAPEAKMKATIPTAPLAETPGPTRPKLRMRTLMISLILLTLVASFSILGLILYEVVPAGSTLSIKHTPVPDGVFGTPIQITANVNGTARSVTLHYAAHAAPSFTEAQMSQTKPGQYSYLIPGEKVTGNVLYYILAADTLGHQVQTSTFLIPVGDFTFSTTAVALTVYRNSSASIALSLFFVNDFKGPVQISATGTPTGIAVSFTPNSATPAAPIVTMSVVADSASAIGTFQVTVSGTYASDQASQLVRQAIAKFTVTDFDLQATPSSTTISAGGTATYTVTVTIQSGFADHVQLTVQGLPAGANYELVISGTTMALGGPGNTVITLRIITTAFIRSGTYALTINAAGGGIIHRQTVQLIVR